MNENSTKQATEILATIADTTKSGGKISMAKTSWTRGDRVSVFNGTTGNERWRLLGETGERNGVLSRMNGEQSRTAIDGVVAIYPYEFHNKLSDNGNACINIPAQQTYCATRPTGTMVAYGSEEGLSFCNIGCCIEIGLTGNARICRLEIRGNAGEALAGVVEIDRNLNATFIDKANDKITVDCGEGIELGSVPTRFCFAMLPQTFEQGLTITIFDSEERFMTYKVDNHIVLGKSEIFSVAETEYIGRMPTNCIWYASVNDDIVEPHSCSEFDANIVSNTCENGKGIITFDKDITRIGLSAFYGCKSLTSIIIPDSVKKIEDSAFDGCARLASVTIPDSVTVIGASAFRGCEVLKSVVVPDSVTEIKDYTFYYCKLITRIIIPDSVIRIGEVAFGCCSGLTSITIPASVTSIGKSAFYDCTNLISVHITDITSWCALNFCITNVRDKVICSDGNPLYYAKYLYLNSKLVTDMVIPDSVTCIRNNVFMDCASLKNVFISNGVIEICRNAFRDCTQLIGITIPDSVEVINMSAFMGCVNLVNIYCKRTTPPTISSDAFDNIAPDAKIYVPRASVSAYKSADGWRDYASQIVGYDF